jgi:hypothetical protein
VLDTLLRLLPRRLTLRKATAQRRLRIVKAEVKRLALCRRGKNGLTTLYKADGQTEFQTLCKAEDEGSLLAVMYAPERVDADGHVAGPEVVEEMLHTLMRNGAELDIEHDGKVLAKSQAYIAEAFVVQKGDARFQGWTDYDGTPAGDLSGAAAVKIKIEDPELRASRRRGDWDGVSLFGPAVGIPEVAPLSKSTQPPEDTMNPEQFAQLLKALTDTVGGLQTSLVKAVTDAVKPADDKTDDKTSAPDAPALPAFEGDVDSVADLATYEKTLRKSQLTLSLAGKDTKAVDKAIATVVDMRKALSEEKVKDEDAGIEAGDSDEVRDLKVRLFKAQRGTNAPAGPAPTGKSVHEQNVELGLELAKAINREGDNKPSFVWDVR